eukprot:jgi/Tetstr1/448931/TSEL_036157.t1
MLPCGNLDATLVRYAKAVKWDLQRAADKLEKTVLWRAENDVAHALTRMLPEDVEDALRKNIPAAFIGHSKQGAPVFLNHTTGIDIVAIMKAGANMDDYVFYHVRAMEYLVNCQFQPAADHHGCQVVDSQCIILDLKGLSLKMLNSMTLSAFRTMSTLYQDHYPELMSMMFLVNVPAFFSTIWRMVSSTLDETVRQKIFFLRPRDFDVMKDFVDDEVIPATLGGLNMGEGGRLLNDTDGYINVIQRQMYTEIARRQAEASIRGKQQSQKTDATSLDSADSSMGSWSGNAKGRGVIPSCLPCTQVPAPTSLEAFQPLPPSPADSTPSSRTWSQDGLETSPPVTTPPVVEPKEKRPQKASRKSRGSRSLFGCMRPRVAFADVDAARSKTPAPPTAVIDSSSDNRPTGRGLFQRFRRRDLTLHKSHSCREIGIGNPSHMPGNLLLDSASSSKEASQKEGSASARQHSSNLLPSLFTRLESLQRSCSMELALPGSPARAPLESPPPPSRVAPVTQQPDIPGSTGPPSPGASPERAVPNGAGLWTSSAVAALLGLLLAVVVNMWTQ